VSEKRWLTAVGGLGVPQSRRGQRHVRRLRQGLLGDESGGTKDGQEQCSLNVSSPQNSVIPTGAERSEA